MADPERKPTNATTVSRMRSLPASVPVSGLLAAGTGAVLAVAFAEAIVARPIVTALAAGLGAAAGLAGLARLRADPLQQHRAAGSGPGGELKPTGAGRSPQSARALAAADASVSAEQAHTALRRLTESVLVVDTSRQIVFANPAAEKLLRAPGDTGLCGLDLERVFGEGRDAYPAFADAAAAIERTLDGGEPGALDGIEYDGRVLEVEVERSGRGPETAAVLVVHDITARREIERLKDVFLSSVSHELRTPLTNICAFVELLRGLDPASPEWREFLGVVEAESQRLSRQVNSLLDFSRLRAGEVRWAIEPLGLGRIVREVTELFRPRVAAAGREFRVRGVEPRSAEADALQVRADRAWLLRCLSELLDNAIKFSPAGGRITLEITPGESFHELAVEDEGPGIAAKDRERVFLELEQLAGDGMTSKPDGIGLGLTLARAALEAMGGRLECRPPQDGAGARVCCLVPSHAPAVVPSGGAR